MKLKDSNRSKINYGTKVIPKKQVRDEKNNLANKIQTGSHQKNLSPLEKKDGENQRKKRRNKRKYPQQKEKKELKKILHLLQDNYCPM